MARHDLFPLADKALHGRLEDRLRGERGEGRSFARIAYDLTVEGIQVSDETVRRWCRELGIEKPRATPEPEQVA